MAVGPTQLNSNFKHEVDTFEKLIDGALLRKSLSPSGKIMIATPLGVTDSHLISLIDRYVKAGWKRVYREFGDQRDPFDCLIFIS